MRMLAAASAAFALALPWTGPQPHKSATDVLARVADSQGLAFFRPLARERWTPIDARSTLMAGDSLKTSARGANAIQLRLGKGGSELLVGPGALLRFVDETRIQLVRGEIEVLGGKEPVQLVGPRDRQIKAPSEGKRLVFRADGSSMSAIDAEPAWLRGYRASATSEWLGSLIAQVDGRDVALTIGSIKISVEIRDQIARTTIEEAFENNTKNTLEGVFRFPLPADASISGFGMWIGDELVEADIVEKQKARRIYEQILRERRDPGLLEWDGGNLFKARVFPIFPNSKKRIRIRYTQVLPLEGRTIRYRYPLRSELLAKFPLDQLVIDAKVWSKDELVSLSSPTHAIQASTDGSTASARFEDENVSPQQDFELRAELAEASPVRMVPHVRDQDGYFMTLLHTPGQDTGAWQRRTTPEGEALDVVLVADVSGSMDESARATQRSFIEATLSMLGEKDRFRLLSADASVRAFSESASKATPEAIAQALEWLDSRRSLGWTDLEASLARVAELANDSKSVVIYVGDGIDTAGDGDAAALAQRLRARYQTSAASFHVAYPSASYEQAVVDAIASIGQGSQRRIDAKSPSASASALLREARSPALENIELHFEGLQTARVYPSTLPRLPRGMQHTVLGRFLPSDKATEGRVVVRGTLDGKTVEFARPVRIPARSEQDAELSFVPRLWARKHLDALLAEGSKTKTQREKIVGFSEEFGIMTPLTSFLVLESDADRERFGVERRVAMRDGEDFFAKARDRATETLLREQLAKVRGWRRKLQREMYLELAGLGRNLHAAIGVMNDTPRYSSRLGMPGGGGGRYGGLVRRGFSAESGTKEFPRSVPPGAPVENAFDRRAELLSDMPAEEAEESLKDARPSPNDSLFLDSARDQLDSDYSIAPSGPSTPGPTTRGRGNFEIAKKSLYRPSRRPPASASGTSRLQQYALPARERVRVARSSGLRMLGFPSLGTAPAAPKPIESEISAEIRELLESLDRRSLLSSSATALRVRVLRQQIHPRRQIVTSEQSSEALLAGKAWRVLSGGGLSDTSESWLLDGTRGVLLHGLMLGRKRGGTEHETRRIPLRLPGGSLDSWLRRFRTYSASIRARDGDKVTIDLTLPRATGKIPAVTQIVIDRARSCVLELRTLTKGEVTSKSVFSDFVTAIGKSWATKVETFDAKNKRTQSIAIQVEEVASEAAEAELRAARAADKRAIYAPAKDPEIDAAKNAYAQRKTDIVDVLRLHAYRISRQEWDKSAELLGVATKLVTALQDRDALTWIRAEFTRLARRADDFTRAIDKLVERADEVDGRVRQWHAETVYRTAQSRLSNAERLALLTRLRSTFEKPNTNAGPIALHWGRREAALIRDTKGYEEYGQKLAELIQEHPWSLATVQDCGRNLSTIQRYAAARAFWKAQQEREGWTLGERDGLATARSSFLWQMRHLDELRTMLAEWTKSSPENIQSWHRWLAVEMFSDEVAACDAWVERTMRDLPPKLDATTRAKLFTCIQHGFGNGWSYSTNRLTPQWSARLLDLARALLVRDETKALRTITGSWYWRRKNDVREAMHRAIVADLLQNGRIEAMPLAALEYRLDELRLGKGILDEGSWTKIQNALLARWKACVAAGEDRKSEEPRIAMRILRHCDGQGMATQALDFARARLTSSTASQKRSAAAQLWTRVLRQDDVAAVQREAAQLLPVVTQGGDEQAVLQRSGDAVRALASRVHSLLYKRELGDEAARKKLTRAERKLLTKRSRVTADRELSSWLRGLDLSTPFAAWLELEAAGYDSQRSTESTGARRSLLRAAITSAKRIYGEADPDPRKAGSLTLRKRAAILAAYAAARREADSTMRGEVLAWLETLPVQTKETAAKTAVSQRDLDGRYHVARFLLATDSVEALEERVRAWIRPENVASRWRVLAGYLRAERRDLAQAIELFERVRSLDELQGEELGLLANWKLVLGDRQGRAESLRAQASALSTYDLRNRISAETNRVSRRGSKAAPALDPRVFGYIEALLRKESYPSNQIWVLRNLYRRTKDHRILEQLPAGVVGHTQQAVYRFLGRVHQLIGNVHEEASCDRMDRALVAQLQGAKSDLDRRGLHLLRALIRGRAADVRNASGPHEAVALDALRKSFDPDSFTSGEILLRAEFLRNARLSGDALQRERVRQLEELHSRCDAGSPEHLATGLHLASQLHGRDAGRATMLLESALTMRSQKRGGGLPSDARSAWTTYQKWQLKAMRFAQVEGLALRFERSTRLASERRNMRAKIRTIRIAALRGGGRVSIGSGEELYKKLRTEIESEIAKTARNTLSLACQSRNELALAAHHAAIAGADEDYIRYANTLLPEAVRSVPRASNYSSVGRTIEKLSSPYTALEFAVARHEAQPKFWRRIGNDVWNQLGYYVAKWRSDSRVLGNLNERLTRVVRAELEDCLVTLRSRSAAIWTQSNRRYWQVKRQDFLQVAQKVLELHADSPARIAYATNYLWNGLGAHKRAVAARLEAEARGKLREADRRTLATWCLDRRVRRAQDALRIADALLAEDAFRIDDRITRIRALRELGRSDEARAEILASEKLFREQKRLSDSVLDKLATSSSKGKLHDLAARFWQEGIDRRDKALGGVARPDSRTSWLHNNLCISLVALKRWPEAFAAAKSARVAAGSNRQRLKDATNALDRVLSRGPLDKLVAMQDAEAVRSGRDAPIVRKAFAEKWLAQRQNEKAIEQIRLALELQGNDPETWTLLVRAHDARGDAKGAIASLADAMRALPFDLARATDYAKRLSANGDRETAKRAWTNLVEARPSEAETHRKLALRFETWKTWPAAILRWRRVTELRSEEPEGWFALVRALLAGEQRQEATKTLRAMLDRTWEERFGDVKGKVAQRLAGIGAR